MNLKEKILAKPFAYNLFTKIMGGPQTRRYLCEKYIRIQNNQSLLDLGCGSGNMVPFLPKIQYLGVDANPEYITNAKNQFSDLGFEFETASIQDYSPKENQFDVVLGIGFLHHLDDDSAIGFLKKAQTALKPKGRLVTMDGCYTPSQNPIARFLLNQDRGNYVRFEKQYLNLANQVFSDIKPHIEKNLLRFPYTHIIMECTKS